MRVCGYERSQAVDATSLRSVVAKRRSQGWYVGEERGWKCGMEVNRTMISTGRRGVSGEKVVGEQELSVFPTDTPAERVSSEVSVTAKTVGPTCVSTLRSPEHRGTPGPLFRAPPRPTHEMTSVVASGVSGTVPLGTLPCIMESLVAVSVPSSGDSFYICALRTQKK